MDALTWYVPMFATGLTALALYVLWRKVFG